MTRRDFITPSTLPTETQGRCISIPASQEWLGLINAALLMLTEEWRYEQLNETDLTPEQAAAAAYDIYVAYLESECAMSCCPLRRNPNTGLLEQSPDGGLSWFQVDDGPWIDPPVDGSIYWPNPKTRTGDDETLKCAAAWAAANVLQSYYQQTVGWALNWAVGGAIAFAQNLARGVEILSGVAIGANLIGTAQALYEQSELFTDGGFPDEDLGTLRDLLYCRAAITDGVVTFDFDGVEADIGALSGTPWDGLSFLLALYLGEDGLNAAGNVDFDDSDCSSAECAPWSGCCTFPFADEDAALGWTAANGVTALTPDGWHDTAASAQVLIEREFGGTINVSAFYMDCSISVNAGAQLFLRTPGGTWTLVYTTGGTGVGIQREGYTTGGNFDATAARCYLGGFSTGNYIQTAVICSDIEPPNGCE